MLRQTIESLKSNPQKLFLVDGLGALLSAFLLGVVLVRLENIFGIPPLALYILAIPPIIFAIYDFYYYRKPKHQLGRFLKGIAIMNILYCFLSISLAFYHHSLITGLGWGYIIVEVVIVCLLVLLELKVSWSLSVDN